MPKIFIGLFTVIFLAPLQLSYADSFTVNIPDSQGGYIAVVIQESGKEYIGPKGEHYVQFPTVAQLQVVYATGASNSAVVLAPAQSDVVQMPSEQDTHSPNTMVEGSANNLQRDTEVVIIEGAGISVEEATKNALRNAVDKVVDSLLDSKVRVENDQIIQDTILLLSRGFISHYDVLDTRIEKGLEYVKVNAVVAVNNLADKLTEEKIFVKEIKPDEIKKSVTAVSLKIEQTEENKEYIRSVLSEFPRSVLKTELVGQLEIADVEAGNVTIKLVGRVSIDENAYNEFTRKLILGLDKIAIKKETAVIDYVDKETADFHHVVDKEILPMSPGDDNRAHGIDVDMIDGYFHAIGRIEEKNFPELSRNSFDSKFFVFSLPKEITSDRKEETRVFYLLYKDKNSHSLEKLMNYHPRTFKGDRWVRVRVKLKDSAGDVVKDIEVSGFGRENVTYADGEGCPMMMGADLMSVFFIAYWNDFRRIRKDLVFEEAIEMPKDQAEKIAKVEMEVE